MTTVIPSTRRHRLVLSLSWLPVWLIGCLCLVSSAGCRGCLRDDTEQLSREEMEKRAREQKEALEAKPLRTLPADTDIAITTAKAGHWVETVRQFKSNREDLQVVASGDVLRGPDKVLNIPHTSISAEFARPTVLPKGQTKSVDLQYFVPTTSISVDPNNPTSTVLRLRSSLLSRSLLTPIMQEQFSAAELLDSEFIITVVSPKPQEYAFLSATDLVMWRGSDLMLEERLRCYRVVLCASKDGKIELPSSLMTMTMMSIMLWDDLSPDDLSEDQKTAIVDWLHWGGQIIVSGPGSWSRLQNSFLSPYLPIRGGDAIELGTEDLEPLNHWVVPDLSGQAQEPLSIIGNKMPGLKMTLHEQGSWLPHAGELIAERAAGRGRVVVTGFPLRDQRLYRWKYFSSLFSTGILRRPARTVMYSDQDRSVTQQWAPPHRGDERNPLFNSNLRIASRDIPLKVRDVEGADEFAKLTLKERQNRLNTMNPSAVQTGFQAPYPENEPAPVAREYGQDALEPVQWDRNGAAWSDTSGFAFSAISTLRQAAGIVLPSRMTIMTLIGCYLLFLVPLNYVFFRLIGRLELAWVVAPLMALAGVLIVTRVARLDIGFARRTTEIGLLELQGEYPRAHLTNYAAMYTSLSTNYALELPERGSVVLPLGNVSQGARRSGTGNKIVQAKYGTSAGMRMEPVTVRSNSTEMMHAEQMVSLPGALMFGIPDPANPDTVALKNTTGLALKACCLLRKNENNLIQIAWLGDMLDDNSRTARFSDVDAQTLWEHWNKDPVTEHPANRRERTEQEATQNTKANELLMGDLLLQLSTSVPLVPGQVRLLGYTDDRPGKMDLSPGDGRLDTRTVVMAHLRPAPWTPVTRDKQVFGRIAQLVEPPETNDPPTDERAP